MDFLNFNNMKLELIKDNTTDEKYICITPPINFVLKKSVVLDSINNLLKIKLTDDSKIDILKNQIINEIYTKSKEIYGKQKEFNIIKDYYCDVKRLFLFNNNYEEIILVNNKTNLSIHKNSYIQGTIQINKIWISNKSYGPVFELINYDQVLDQNNNEFLNDSDNESVIEYDF